MRKPSFSIAPEGAPFIALFAVSCLAFAALRWWPLALVFLAGTWFAAYFFRDPERVVPDDADLAVSPADGKIVRIEPREDPVSGERRVCVSIFMNVFDVHVNRSPVTGKIKDIIYYPGRFMNAALDKASEENERCIYVLEDSEKNSWTMVQIAGLVARRIVCRAETGDKLSRGERYGLIRFGSRVDLYLPENYNAHVYVGDTVVAGESILARKRAG